jgi:hypothetical protein
VDLSSTDVRPRVVRAYLSRQDFEDVENSCPMIALPTDVARSGISAKRAFETVFKAMVSVLERSLIHRRRKNTDGHKRSARHSGQVLILEGFAAMHGCASGPTGHGRVRADRRPRRTSHFRGWHAVTRGNADIDEHVHQVMRDFSMCDDEQTHRTLASASLDVLIFGSRTAFCPLYLVRSLPFRTGRRTIAAFQSIVLKKCDRSI